MSTVEAAAKVKLDTKKMYLTKGRTKTLTLLKAKGKIKWSSTKPSVATVSRKGVVRGRKVGKTIIIAKYRKKSYKCKVIVESPKISKSKITLQVGKSSKLKLLNTKQKVIWSTSDESIATVTSKGLVKAKKAGKATIYAEVGTRKYKCVVTVRAINLLTQNTFIGDIDKFLYKYGGKTDSLGNTYNYKLRCGDILKRAYYVCYALNGEYTVLNFDLALNSDYKSSETVTTWIEIYDEYNNLLCKTTQLGAGSRPEKYTVDISGVNDLYIYAFHTGSGEYGIRYDFALTNGFWISE